VLALLPQREVTGFQRHTKRERSIGNVFRVINVSAIAFLPHSLCVLKSWMHCPRAVNTLEGKS
jgi:hypothetical protein